MAGGTSEKCGRLPIPVQGAPGGEREKGNESGVYEIRIKLHLRKNHGGGSVNGKSR